MITINEQMYNEIGFLLNSKIENLNFFNGAVEYDTEEFYSELICTLIICRDDQGGILSVLPVWWEYHMYMSEGEQLNDFDWNELCKYLK